MAAIRAGILVPALRKAALDRRSTVRAGAMLALGKVGDHGSFRDLYRGLSDTDLEVRKAALLGLAYLGREDDALVHEQILLDRKEDPRLRAFAAGGLALLGSPGSADALVRTLLDRREPVDVRAAAGMALGFVPDERGKSVLLAAMKDAREDPRIRAVAAGALGRLGDADLAPALARALTDRAVEVRRSAALALGALRFTSDAEALLEKAREARKAWIEDDALSPEARRALEAEIEELTKRAGEEMSKYRSLRRATVSRLIVAAEKGSDQQTMGFALMSLGEIDAPEALAPIRAILGKKSHRLLPWACLAAGVSGDKAFAPYLREIHRRGKSDPSLRAAAAIALGLLGDRAVADDLIRSVRDPGEDPDLRGYSITALALIGDSRTRDVAAEVFRTKGNPSLHRNAAIALGVTGRSDSGGRLVDLMVESNDLYVKAAATIGLGYVRDRTTAERLAAEATNGETPFLSRLFFVLAVGYLGDRQAAPPALSELAWFHNYRIAVASLERLTSLL
jgi:HEAT repeat protein